MSNHDLNAQLRRNVRGFYAGLGSVAIGAVSPFIAMALIRSESAALRLAGVATGVLGWVPLMWVLVRVIRHGDEFNRRIYLVSLSWAFAGALLLVSAIDWLVRADFIEPPEFAVLWLLIALLWIVSITLTKLYYERQQ
jgi:4-amino-4-deoxy-L-arabinose transferase-like glycosyltransferase